MQHPARAVLQIVPRLPGTYDGVGDYALTLAKTLARDHGRSTIFAVARETSITDKDGFRIVSGLSADLLPAADFDDVILHYANYGYEARGVPSQLLDFSRALRPRLSGRWLTMFHELYASGPPWKSAFWMRPFQMRIARDLMDLSDKCFASNLVIEKEIHRHSPKKPVRVLPVMSNFGEPKSLSFGHDASKTWAICGGTALVERSLRSFLALRDRIPEAFMPERLAVMGGNRNENVADLVNLADRRMQLPCSYHPEITAERASEILSQCAFGWLDYFGRGKVWPTMIFKSGSFAAFCAHGVVPVLAHDESALGLEGDNLPGPFVMTRGNVRFPAPEELSQVRRDVHAWYQRHASSEQTARAYAEALA